ncbi:MAG: hypothetical protein IJ086_15185 [Clostridium sp.]|nr:hypothetical protein [Clostridium sp.]
MKIGQEVVIREDFKINTILSEKVMIVKKGEKGFLNRNGCLHITTGKAKGKIIKIDDIEIKGYDYQNISKMIFNRLKNSFGIEDFLIEEDIEPKYFIEEIEDMLSDIL